MRTFTDPVTGDEMIDILARVHTEMGLERVVLPPHGTIRLLDVMPRLVPKDIATADFCLADAARQSYQKGTRKVNADGALIDYLVRHLHTSPIEMAELKFQVRMPICVARQWGRHRTFSINEESARYSQLRSDFYIPDELTVNVGKQQTEQATVSYETKQRLLSALESMAADQYDLYQTLLRTDDPVDSVEGVDLQGAYRDIDEILKAEGLALSREQARMVLGTNVYTSWVCKVDLLNLLKFLTLRLDKHAQREIRLYANAIANWVSALFPAAWASWQDHMIDGIRLSKTELDILGMLLSGHVNSAYDAAKDNGWSKRRAHEFVDKVKLIDPELGVGGARSSSYFLDHWNG